METSSTPKADAWREKIRKVYGDSKTEPQSLLNMLYDLEEMEKENAKLREELRKLSK